MEILSSVAKELNLKLSQVENTVNLFDEGATVPFIARYRKEVTGNLDEEQIREVIEKVTYYRNLEKKKRRSYKTYRRAGKTYWRAEGKHNKRFKTAGSGRSVPAL